MCSAGRMKNLSCVENSDEGSKCCVLSRSVYNPSPKRTHTNSNLETFTVQQKLSSTQKDGSNRGIRDESYCHSFSSKHGSFRNFF